jgi:hypothetical protein
MKTDRVSGLLKAAEETPAEFELCELFERC